MLLTQEGTPLHCIWFVFVFFLFCFHTTFSYFFVHATNTKHHRFAVRDLNKAPSLPYPDAAFDCVVCGPSTNPIICPLIDPIIDQPTNRPIISLSIHLNH